MSFLLAAIAVGALCASASGGFLFASRRRAAGLRNGSGAGDEDDKETSDDGDAGKRDAGPGKDGSKRDDSKRGAAKRDGGKRDGDRSTAGSKADSKRAFESLPLALGDVVIADHEERWLAGGLVAREGDKVVAAIFFAPEGAATKVVVAFARPRRDVLWLSPARVDSPAEPPASVEIDGVAMTRRGRLPIVLSRHGQGVPSSIGETGIFAEYEGGADEVAVLVTSGGRAFAWTGKKLDEDAYDRLGSGGEG